MMLFPVLSHLPLTTKLASVVFASLWQGTLLVLLVAVILRLLPGLTAAARGIVWAVALGVIALHPLVVFAGHTSGAASPGSVHVGTGFSVALAGAWLLASLFRLFQLLIGGVELWRTLRTAQPLAAPPAIAALVSHASRRPQLCVSETVNRPCVAGFFRPRVLLPSDLLASLNEAEMSQIVLHELEHLRRGDDWVHLLQQLALVVLPLHPALFWLNRRLALERELACDDAVLATTRASKAYAACLAHVAEQSLLRRGLSLAIGALGNLRRRSELASRVDRILRQPERTLSGTPLRLTTGLVLAGTLAAGGVLAHGPTLVSFGDISSSSTSVASNMSAPMGGALMLPVISRIPAAAAYDRPHPLLLKATLPITAKMQMSARRIFAKKGVSVRTLAGAVRQSGARSLANWRSTPARRRMDAPAPRVLLAGWQRDRSRQAKVSTPRLLPAGFQPQFQPVVVERQVWYTAVRVIQTPDGWLVFQL